MQQVDLEAKLDIEPAFPPAQRSLCFYCIIGFFFLLFFEKHGSLMQANWVTNALQFNLGVRDNCNQFQPPSKVLCAVNTELKVKVFVLSAHVFLPTLRDYLY